MNIDFDKFRQVLTHLRDNESSLGRAIYISGLTNKETNLYLGLHLDEGLIEANRFANKMNGVFYYPTRITLKGHKFLEVVSDNSNWEKAKKIVKYAGTIIGIVELVKFVIESATKS